MRNRSGFLHVAAASVALLGVLAPMDAKATTITQFVELTDPNFSATGPGSTSFSQFDPANGTLNAVTFQYTVNGVTPYVTFVARGADSMFYGLYDPSFQTQLAKAQFSFGSGGAAGVGMTSLVTSDPNLSQYVGLLSLTLKYNFSRSFSGNWAVVDGNPSGAPLVAITYDYTAAEISATPLPAALPLFAAGLGVMGLLGWRRKRKDPAIGGSVDAPAA
jgi:hypothetical protein